MNETISSPNRRTRLWLAWILAPLLLGVLVSLAIPRPVVGMIYLDDAIYSYSARELIAQIDYARDTPEVRAVVLVMNSPGGTVSDTESVYRELAALRETKPVVTVIEGMAASGGYYLSCGTDYIIAKASSDVGNVGVIGYLPTVPYVMEEVISTGPYKMWGANRDSFIRQVEMLKQGFLNVVQLGRGSALKADPEVILTGQLWPGSEALELGLIDEMGTKTRAVEKAAEMAKISHYKTLDLHDQISISTPSATLFFFQTPNGILTPYPQKAGIYMLYIPPSQEELP